MGKATLFLLQLLAVVNADVYLHSPRGSNNRLDGAGRERRNANRMFDSQNNNRGGYNVGGSYYYAGSIIPIEWTNQHSCNDPNNKCEIIIQYMCGQNVRDGTSHHTIPDNPLFCAKQDCNTDQRYGMHESYDYFMKCHRRERNKGLFTADQVLRGHSARHTRQNPQATRRGYECPEERDYYPYWKPSPWKDIVVFTNDVSMCEHYQNESQNVKERYECVVPEGFLRFAVSRRIPLPNNKKDCEMVRWPLHIDGEKGKWTKVPAHNIPPPECLQSPWSRDNHNGNGMGGYPNMYNWTTPDISSERCALRIRYNISTNDFSRDSDSRHNGQGVSRINIGQNFGMNRSDAISRGYVFKQNPEVQPLSGLLSAKLKLRLAINTAQYGRTFQDRSHTFAIRQRPTSLKGKRILNVNVRGKRGNIVQVYPAVEYDFVPNVLSVSKGDYIHFQWTGSNSNPHNNDGQGQRGSDRSNVLLLASARYAEGKPGAANPFGKFGHWGRSYPEHISNTTLLGLSRQDLINLALLEPGHFGGNIDELDDAGTYFDLGPRQVTSVGTFHYMCTRNNNFSNRSQKGKIIVMHIQASGGLIGWSGGKVVLQDGIQGIFASKDVMDGSKYIEIKEWSVKEGEWYIKHVGGKMSHGSTYASKFITIEPYLLTKKEKTVTMKIKTTHMSNVKVYRSVDAKTWTEVPGGKFSGGLVSFKTDRGGIYVARKH